MDKEKVYMTDELRDRISLVPKDKKGRWKTLDIFQIAKEQALEIESLRKRIAHLEKVAADASWTAEMYRDQIDDRPKW